MNDITKYPEEARRLIYRGDDLKARWLLTKLAEAAYAAGQPEASASLMHAEYYLADRLCYQLFPAPKNKIKLMVKE